jgi:hypothetical protein
MSVLNYTHNNTTGNTTTPPTHHTTPPPNTTKLPQHHRHHHRKLVSTNALLQFPTSDDLLHPTGLPYNCFPSISLSLYSRSILSVLYKIKQYIQTSISSFFCNDFINT